jgi:hypothetical protein
MRPEGGSAEELQAWNNRCVAEAFARLEQSSRAKATQQMTLAGKEDSSGVPAVAVVPAERLPPEAAQPIAPEGLLRLPYSFNLMNPADVPEEVWRQARAAQQNTL